MTKRFLAVATALLMVLMLLPGAALAEGTTSTINLTEKEGLTTNTSESIKELFDGHKTFGDASKWCVTMPTDGAYVIFEASDVIRVTKYTLYTGNDTQDSNRNPQDWVLYGCNDYIGTGTGTWTAIHTVTGDTTMPNANFASADFTISSSAYYKYYKLHVTATQGDSAMQLGELEFTGYDTCSHNWSSTTTTAATCTLPGYTTKTCSICGVTVNAPGDAAIHKYGTPTGAFCTVCGASVPAKVGDTYYADLQTAADAAKDGGTVTLLSDITIAAPLVITGTVTLDLNGHRLSCTASDADACAIKIGDYPHAGYLTLTDSAGGGSISCPAGKGVRLSLNNCSLTMNGGTITGCATGVSISGSTFTMNGGTIESCSGNAVYLSNSTMYAHGGAVYGSVSVSGDEYKPAIITRKDDSVTGSTAFYGTVSNIGADGSGLYAGIISWGTFYGQVKNWNSYIPIGHSDPTYGSGSITGGTFYGTVTVYDNVNTITGGTFLGGIKKESDSSYISSISGFTNVEVKFVYPDGTTQTKTATVKSGGSFVLNGGPEPGDVEWYSDADCTEPYPFGTAVASPLTLYGKSVAKPTPTTPTVPTTGSGSSASLWYVGGNTFGSSRSAVPTAVEIDGAAVAFSGNGSSFTVSSLPAAARWITVRWNSTSITISFTPDANAYTANVAIPKTGDMPVWAAIAEFFGF